MIINTNLPAQTGARLLAESTTQLNKSLARLSSGLKLAAPEDDAAGAAVSLRFDAQINRIGAVRTNISNAVSYSQTQDGYLRKIAKAMDRMSELAVLAQDVTKSADDIALYQTEFNSLATFINSLATKEFNGVALFDGTTRDVTTDEQGAVFSLTGIVGSSYDLTGQDLTVDAPGALSEVVRVIDLVAADRATIGASISTLNFYSEQLAVLKDNLTAANSRIKDVDVAEESATFARYNILVQAGTAMLAQANSTPQSVLKLIQ